MKYYVEESLENFNAWSGAKDTLATLIEKGNVESIEMMIEELYPEGDISDTEVNDFLWFETDAIAEYLGYDSWEDYVNPEDEDDKEEDD